MGKKKRTLDNIKEMAISRSRRQSSWRLDSAYEEPWSDGKECSFDIRHFEPYITCTLCKGYLRQAHCVKECLHTFCKVCIRHHFYHSLVNTGTIKCPECDVQCLRGQDPKALLKYDAPLQAIVDLIIAQLEEEKVKDTSSNTNSNVKASTAGMMRKSSKDDSIIFILKSIGLPEEIKKIIPKEWNDKIELKDLKKPLMKTSCSTTLNVLKKYISFKLQEEEGTIDIVCNGEIVKGNHNLKFVEKTRWKSKDVLELGFRRKFKN